MRCEAMWRTSALSSFEAAAATPSPISSGGRVGRSLPRAVGDGCSPTLHIDGESEHFLADVNVHPNLSHLVAPLNYTMY